MNKEELIELKNKLQRKYVGVDCRDTHDIITQYEIEQKHDEQGALDNLENYFVALITYLLLKKISFDELMISCVYELFYKEEDIEGNSPIKNAKALNDYVIVSFGGFKAMNNKEKYDEDPELVYQNCYAKFIVSFNEFKMLLEQRGFDIGTLKTFEEIETMVNNREVPLTFFALKFSKKKKIL